MFQAFSYLSVLSDEWRARFVFLKVLALASFPALGSLRPPWESSKRGSIVLTIQRYSFHILYFLACRSASLRATFRDRLYYVPPPGKKVQELAIGGRNEILLLPSAGSAINDGHRANVERKANNLNLEHRDGTDGGFSDFRDTDGSEKNGNILDDASVSPLGSDGQKDNNWKYLERCIVACIKGFAIGSGLRGGLALVTILSQLKKRKPR